MNQPNKNNAFKKIIPQEELTPKDKEAVLKTIENAKLFLDMFDLVSAKHVKTRFGVVSAMAGGEDPGSDSTEEEKK